MQAFMPLTQVATPSKGSAPEAKKPAPEKDGDDFGSVFDQNAPREKPEPKEQVDYQSAEAGQADATDEEQPESNAELASDGEEIGLVDSPLKHHPEITKTADRAIEVQSKIHATTTGREYASKGVKTETAEYAGADPKQAPTTATQTPRSQPVMAARAGAVLPASNTEMTVTSVAGEVETPVIEQQQSTRANLFGLQLHRGIGEPAVAREVAAVVVAAQPAQPKAAHFVAVDEVSAEVATTGDGAKSSPVVALPETKPMSPGAQKEVAPSEPLNARRSADASFAIDAAAPRKTPNTQISVQAAPKPAVAPESDPTLKDDVAKVAFDTQMEVQADLRVQPSHTRLEPTLAVQRPEMARHVGAQLAEVLPRAVNGPVELSLNPEELGKVRISLSAVDTGITMSVTAERPETIDLMRRHIDQLAQEFKALGYGSINFDFNQQPGAEGQQSNEAVVPDDKGSGALATDEHAAADTSAGVLRVISDSLDLRL